MTVHYEIGQNFKYSVAVNKHFISSPARFKVGSAFPMVISSDLRMGKHRDDDHEEDAPYFTRSLRSLRFSSISKWIFSEKATKKSLSQFEITLTNFDFYQELIDNLQSHCQAKYYRGSSLDGFVLIRLMISLLFTEEYSGWLDWPKSDVLIILEFVEKIPS